MGGTVGRNEWTLLIAYPDKKEPSISQAGGSRGDAIATAHKRIDGWMRRQRERRAPAPIPPTDTLTSPIALIHAAEAVLQDMQEDIEVAQALVEMIQDAYLSIGFQI